MSKKSKNTPHNTIFPYIIAIIVMFGISVVAMVQMQRISSGLDAMVIDLTAEQDTASTLVNLTYYAQTCSHRYFVTSDEEDADMFYEALWSLERRLGVLQTQTDNPQRQRLLKHVEYSIKDYDREFTNLVNLIYELQDIENDMIYSGVAQFRADLVAVQTTVFESGDTDLHYTFDASRVALETYQQRVSNYLRAPSEPAYLLIVEAYGRSIESLQVLEKTLLDTVPKSHIQQSLVSLTAQQIGVDTYHDHQNKLNSTINKLVNVIEPSIVGKTYDMSDRIGVEMHQEYQDSLASLQQTRVIMILSLSISLIAGATIIGTNLARRRERAAAQQAVDASEARYQALFESLPVCIYRTAPNGDILDVNPGCIRLMNAPDLDSFRDHLVTHYYVDYQDRVTWRNMIDNSEDAVEMDTQLRCYDGTIIWAHMTGQAYRDEQGNITHYEGTLDDITPRIQAQRELQEAQEQLIRQEKLAILGQLAGGVGHDLRNPLGVISNAVYYLRNVLNVDAQASEYLDIIMGEVHNADHIVADLLNFARTHDPEREPVTDVTLLQSAMGRITVPDTINVAYEFGDNLPETYVDPRQIVQVLVNLITNACQAMDNEGTLTLHTQVDSEDAGFINIAVQDTGGGISEENRKHLFEPLFSTKRKGIGLGLVTSRNLTQANGGRIEVQSEAGVGSTFTLCLPTHEHAFRDMDIEQ